jgi:hypothetical protein
MFDWKAVMKDGDEWSFEEVRARARGLYQKEWKDVKEWELNWHYPGCEWLAGSLSVTAAAMTDGLSSFDAEEGTAKEDAFANRQHQAGQ